MLMTDGHIFFIAVLNENAWGENLPMVHGWADDRAAANVPRTQHTRVQDNNAT